MFGAHVGRHQHLHDLEPVVEGERWLLFIEKCLDEMPIFGFIAVGGSFVRNQGHLTDLGVLLLDEVLADFPLNLAAEEQLQSGVERIPSQRVLRPE